MAPSYLSHSRDGRGNGGFYLLGLLVILFIWLVGAGLLMPLLGVLFGGSGGIGADGLPVGGSLAPWQSQVIELVPFVVVLLAVLFTVKWLLGRPARTVITGRPRVSITRLATGFGVFFALTAIGTGLDALLHRDSYAFTFDASRFFPALVVVVLLIPLQSAAEEVLFRGYIVQWTSLGTDSQRRPALAPLPRIAVLAVVSGLVFALPHLPNPEADSSPVFAFLVWFLLGAGWAWTSVLDGRIELAIGAHTANNVFALLVVGNAVAAVPASTVWTTARIDWPFAVVSTAVLMVLFVLITCRGLRPRAETN